MQHKWLLVLALGVALVAGCSSAQQPSPTAKAPAAAAPTVAAAPTTAAAAAPTAPAAAPTTAAAPAKTPQFTFKFGHVVEENQPAHLAAKYFADQVAQKSNGRIKIDIYPLSQLGTETEIIEGMRQGTIDMGGTTWSLFAGFEPKWALYSLPFLFKDSQHAFRVFDSPVGAQMYKMLEPKGVKPFFAGSQGGFVLMSKAPINSPDDVKGKKIRIVPDPISSAMFQNLGAIATPLSWAEVYPALQQGAIDGLTASISAMLTGKMYEPVKNLSVTNHQMIVWVVSMSMKKWEALPPDLQQSVLDAAKEGYANYQKLGPQRAEEDLAKLKQLGVTVTQPNTQPFRDLMQPVYKQFEAQIGKDLIEAALAVK